MTTNIIKNTTSYFSVNDIYHILREEILTLKIAPGDRLSENQISTRFNTSRTPVRNAFAHLSKDGLIDVLPQKGSYVSLIDLDLASQIIFMRIQVETAVMSYIAHHQDTALMVKLQNNLDQQYDLIKQPTIDHEEYYSLDSQFHGLCMRSVNKQKLWALIQQMDVHYSRYRLLDYKAAQDDNVFETLFDEHTEFLQFMKEGKVKELRKAIPLHLYGGFARIHNRLATDYTNYFVNEGKDINDILLQIKLVLNETR